MTRSRRFISRPTSRGRTTTSRKSTMPSTSIPKGRRRRMQAKCKTQDIIDGQTKKKHIFELSIDLATKSREIREIEEGI